MVTHGDKSLQSKEEVFVTKGIPKKCDASCILGGKMHDQNEEK